MSNNILSQQQKRQKQNNPSNNQINALKKELKSELIDSSLSIAEANHLRSMINKHASEIDRIRNQLKALQQASVQNGQPPLATIGSLLTGDIANALHMLVNPAIAPVVGFPGLQKASYGRANMTPYKSIPLLSGIGRVIFTPLGPYQVYVAERDPIAPDASFAWPSTQFFHNPKTAQTRTLTRADPAVVNPATYAIFTTTLATMSVSLIAGSAVRLAVSDAAVGATLAFAGAILQVEAAGVYEFRVAADPITPGVVASTVSVAGIYNDLSLTFDGNYENALEATVKIENAEYVTFNPGLGDCSVYKAWQAPTITSSVRGGYMTSYCAVAASGLFTMDASALIDGGYLNAWTMETAAYPPVGVSFDDWVSGSSNWFYNGQARVGCYQIYIPDDDLNFFGPKEILESTPWTGSRNYNMIITINNSFDSGKGVPTQMQAHVTYGSVFATPDMSNLIPTIAVINDPGFPVALALLRKYYNPCCNPDHLENAAMWLSNVFKDLQGYGSRIIHSPVTKQLAHDAITKGIPFLIEGVPKAIQFGKAIAEALA